jgi:hypothetical protein
MFVVACSSVLVALASPVLLLLAAAFLLVLSLTTVACIIFEHFGKHNIWPPDTGPLSLKLCHLEDLPDATVA